MSAENTKTLDHKAEALRLLEWLGNPVNPARRGDPRVVDALAVASVRSNLAIAEGQERVAEELRRIGKRLDSITEVSARTQFGSGKRYLKVKP